MCVSDIPTRTPVAKAFVAAGRELGFSELDYNARYQQGFSFHQVRTLNICLSVLVLLYSRGWQDSMQCMKIHEMI